MDEPTSRDDIGSACSDAAGAGKASQSGRILCGGIRLPGRPLLRWRPNLSWKEISRCRYPSSSSNSKIATTACSACGSRRCGAWATASGRRSCSRRTATWTSRWQRSCARWVVPKRPPSASSSSALPPRVQRDGRARMRDQPRLQLVRELGGGELRTRGAEGVHLQQVASRLVDDAALLAQVRDQRLRRVAIQNPYLHLHPSRPGV